MHEDCQDYLLWEKPWKANAKIIHCNIVQEYIHATVFSHTIVGTLLLAYIKNQIVYYINTYYMKLLYIVSNLLSTKSTLQVKWNYLMRIKLEENDTIKFRNNETRLRLDNGLKLRIVICYCNLIKISRKR